MDLPGRRLISCRWFAAILVLLVFSSLGGGWARAASTGTASLLMPQGTGAEVQDGDYISSSVTSGCGGCTAVPLNTIYRYYVEVPAGLARLRIQIFDADVGAGGAAEATAQRDRSRSGTFATTAKYTLIRPDATTAATQSCTSTATAFCADDAWTSLLDITTGIQAGHWELDVDQSTTVNGAGATDINAIGIRADDGNQPSGTELPIYYSAQNQIGENPPTGGGSKTYTFYPYVTSGCSFTENDFDFDLNNGNANQAVGSIDFTSRLGTFTDNFPNTSLSTNDVWKSNSVTAFTTDTDSVDYGIWTMTPTIGTYVNGAGLNGNYANIYLANFNSAGGAPANNSPTANTFRVYFPTDAGGAPVKPYLTQQVRYRSGPKTPVSGSTTAVQISVALVNPTAHAVTLSATPANLVTANVPGGRALYGGNDVVSQGTVTAQPAVGGSGNITWNPGTVAANTTALLTYSVNVTPTAAAQRTAVTGTPAANGTMATWVDETGSTTQARATFTFGPLCDLGVTSGTATPVVVSGVRAQRGEHGGALVEWDTSSEIGTVAFDLLRWEPRERRYVQVNRQPVPALLQASQGGHYRFLDSSARGDDHERYALVEHVSAPAVSEQRTYGPFEVELTAPDHDRLASRPLPESGFDRTARASRQEPRPEATPASRSAQAPIAKSGVPSALAIGVRDSGLYFVSAASIAAQLGLSLPVVQGLIAARGFDLDTSTGDVAWMPSYTAPGILFYGQAIDSIYTRDNVYWLRLGAGAAIGSKSGTPPPPAGLESFRDTAHAEQELFPATVVATDPESDYWFWSSLIAGDPTQGSQSFTLNAGGVATPIAGGSSGPGVTAHLRVNLYGASASGVAGEHQAVISLNGTQIGTSQWTGITSQAVDLDFSQSLLQEGANTVQVAAVLNPGVPYSFFYVQSFDLTYARLYRASGDALRLFGGGNPAVTVGGFNGSRIVVFDLTDPNHPAVAPYALAAAPGGLWQVSFAPAAPQTPYLAVSPMGWKTPDWLAASNPQPLRTPLLGADYLIITSQDLLPAAQELAAYRGGQGLKTLVLDVQDIYDVFNSGLPNPHAIHDFLAFAHQEWNPAPRYVVLAGQGNLDYKNNLGFGGNLLPPLMVSTAYGLFASDNHLASSVSPNGLPDMAIGRLPVATNADLHNLVQKIELYESGAAASWSGQALMVADDQSGAGDFSGDSDQIAAALPPGYAAERIYLDVLPADQARNTLLAGLQSGAGLFNYVGHGGLDRLSSTGLLLSSDAASLGNGARQPVVSALTCTINRFELPGFTPLGVALVAQPTGGAAAVWAASGVSMNDAAKLLGQRFYLRLARGQAAGGLRLGDAIQGALRDYLTAGGASDLVDIYELLGDPGLLVKNSPAPQGGATSVTRE